MFLSFVPSLCIHAYIYIYIYSTCAFLHSPDYCLLIKKKNSSLTLVESPFAYFNYYHWTYISFFDIHKLSSPFLSLTHLVFIIHSFTTLTGMYSFIICSEKNQLFILRRRKKKIPFRSSFVFTSTSLYNICNVYLI